MIDSNETVITVVSILGGSDIIVPEGVEVELGGFAILGGNDLKVEGPRPGRERPWSASARSRCWAAPTSRRSARGAPRHHQGMLLRLADPDERYAAVRLCSDLPLDERRLRPRQRRVGAASSPPPPVARLEYQLELVDHDGDIARVCDPGNPQRAPGAFGEKSVLELPGYRPPAGSRRGRARATQALAVTGAGSARRSTSAVWAPRTPAPASRCRCWSRTTARSTTRSPG